MCPGMETWALSEYKVKMQMMSKKTEHRTWYLVLKENMCG
jgi:hypothetical protein